MKTRQERISERLSFACLMYCCRLQRCLHPRSCAGVRLYAGLDMKKYLIATVLMLVAGPIALSAEGESSLRGSRSSMRKQNEIARENDFTFLRTADQIESFVAAGRLVRLNGNADYEVDGASYPYVRPEVELFVRRIGRQHRAACGEPMVVTSATRPLSEQPRNAHPLSVHPAGMAVDLRVSGNTQCRSWLADALLSLEKRALLDVTREYRPPHFHVAVFPEQYAAYAMPLERQDSARAALDAMIQARPQVTMAAAAPLARRSSGQNGTDWGRVVTIVAAVGWAIAVLITRRRRSA